MATTASPATAKRRSPVDVVVAMLNGDHGRIAQEAAQEAVTRAWATPAMNNGAAMLTAVNRTLLIRLTEMVVDGEGNLIPRIDQATEVLDALAEGLR
jgi:hypothetical protein